VTVLWKDFPDEHDFPAAESYLSLHVAPLSAGGIVVALRHSKIVQFKSKDIVRASGLPMLDGRNVHVRRNLAKIEKGVPLSPVLLVRGQPLIIADGYHRVCAVHVLDEDEPIPCLIVSR